MLFVATAISVTGTMNDKKNIFRHSSPIVLDMNSDDDMPVWKVGDSWIYDVDFSINNDDISAHLSLGNLHLIVESDTGDSYHISLASAVDGNFDIDIEDPPVSVSGQLRQTEMDGHTFVRKNTLGIKEVYIHINGKLSINLLRINIDIELRMYFDPSYNPLSFPISVGKEWSINESNVSGECLIALPGIAKLIPGMEDEIYFPIDGIPIGGNNALCTGKENITVEAGLYNAYNITLDDSGSFYYSPVVGNIIKIVPGDSHLFDFDFEFNYELKSTTYTVPGAPNKPSRPSGPGKGKPDVDYTYTASTTDPEGDQVHYLFDWGDGTNSGWIGPFNSGETIDVSKTWTQKGT